MRTKLVPLRHADDELIEDMHPIRPLCWQADVTLQPGLCEERTGRNGEVAVCVQKMDAMILAGTVE